MMKTASVAEVQSAGVTIEPEEAVAVVQQLIDALRRGTAGPAEPPYGPPTPATVRLADDGSVVCRACETMPAVSEVAILLQQMLPARKGIPGGLHYTIARALLDVDVPPFDSLDDLSETLARYERGPRQQIIQRVMHRFDTRRALVPWAVADRRRHPRAAELRRALREADARLYLQKVEAETAALAVASQQPRPRMRAAAACVGAGLLLIGAGEFIDRGGHQAGSAPLVVTSPASPGAAELRDVVATDPPVVNSEPARMTQQPQTQDRPADSGIPAAEMRPPSPERRASPELRRSSTDRRPTTARQAVPAGRTQQPRDARRKTPTSSHSVLQRFRLNWLRNMLTSL